jgi:exodeoxyribonuclease-3
MSPRGAAHGQFRVATWNVNSLKVRAPAIRRFLERARPDVVCLQETKSHAVVPAVNEIFEDLGYTAVHAGSGAYNGVAIAATLPLADVTASAGFDDEHLDREPRLISCVVETDPPVRVVSVYVPHGREIGHWHYEYKLQFLAALARRVEGWVAAGPVVLGGDVNVAPTDSDIFHPDAFVGLTHVTERERSALNGVLEAGLVDLDALKWGARERRFTWWNHGLNYSRNLGMRIDLLAADRSLADRLVTTWIDHVERGAERPSDHAAVLADFAPGDASGSERAASEVGQELLATDQRRQRVTLGPEPLADGPDRPAVGP